MVKEFSLIEKYFNKKVNDVPLGIGDDGALLEKNSQNYYVLSQDTLNVDSHFLRNTNTKNLGWKSLAVNVSDIIAMGGNPKFALLYISTEKVEDKWLKEFSSGLFDCANHYGVSVIGGDTSRGSLSITITIIGEVKKNRALRRDGASEDEDIWISGELGLASLGFAYQMNTISLPSLMSKKALLALHKPKPISIDMSKINHLFSSAIDISDGLIPDIQHILNRSKIGADIFCEYLPVSSWIKKNHGYDFALYGGEDYQLALTAPKKNRLKIKKIAAENNLQFTIIGGTNKSKILQLFDVNGRLIKKLKKGFSHFG